MTCTGEQEIGAVSGVSGRFPDNPGELAGMLLCAMHIRNTCL